jgi:hypothetical protein
MTFCFINKNIMVLENQLFAPIRRLAEVIDSDCVELIPINRDSVLRTL